MRLERGLTQKQVADSCGMADSAIRKYESGKVKPKYEMLQRIAAALGVEWTDLVPTSEQGKQVIEYIGGSLKEMGQEVLSIKEEERKSWDKLNQYFYSVLW